MPAVQETSRRLDEAYVTRALRTEATRSLTDASRGTGFALVLGTPESVVQLHVYPDDHVILLTNHLFSLELTHICAVRHSGARLRFAATHGTQRVAVALSRRGDVSLRARDETPHSSPYQQGILPHFEHDTASPPVPSPVS